MPDGVSTGHYLLHHCLINGVVLGPPGQDCTDKQMPGINGAYHLSSIAWKFPYGTSLFTSSESIFCDLRGLTAINGSGVTVIRRRAICQQSPFHLSAVAFPSVSSRPLSTGSQRPLSFSRAFIIMPQRKTRRVSRVNGQGPEDPSQSAVYEPLRTGVIPVIMSHIAMTGARKGERDNNTSRHHRRVSTIP